MPQSQSDSLTIGDLARRAGVSAGTLRHYHRLGLLKPSRQSRAGYRLYSEQDRERLELIRALRGLDVDLREIGKLLRGVSTLRQVAELHLRTLDLQARAIARRRAVLRLVLRDEQPPSPARLRRLQVLSDFERRERESFLVSELSRRLSTLGATRLPAKIITDAVGDLPDAPSDAQVEAWLELAEIVSDPEFLSRYRTSAKVRELSPAKSAARWNAEAALIYAPVARAVDAGVLPRSAGARPIVHRWARAFRTGARPGAQHGRLVLRDFAHELLRHFEAERDTGEQRFWELAAVLRPSLARTPLGIAWPWLIEALHHIAGAGNGD